MNTGQVKIVHRDSESGEFTTKKYADKHPNTTERERIRMPSPGKRSR